MKVLKNRWLAGLATGLLAAGAFTVAAVPSALASTCTVTNGTCGPYGNDGTIPMANGFNTYVVAQQVGNNSGTSDTITANGPGSWSDVATDVPYGYTGVQMFDNTNQLTNNWTGSGWGSGSSDTPLSSLSALSVTYSETSPQDANSIYEFAPDVWNDNYHSDVMFWADTHGRCNAGAYGSTVLGTATFGGQTWTVNRYGGPGAEIIFVLDSSPSVPDSCASQSSGTIDILAGYEWLAQHGYMNGEGAISQLNTGWEITSADSTTFSMNSYSITATVGSNSGGTPVGSAPSATVSAATGVSSGGATINGSVNPDDNDTSYQFQYGTTTSYGSVVPATAPDIGSGTSAVNVSQNLTSLSPSTTYHYRIAATNALGTSYSSDEAFTTPAVATGDSVWNDGAPAGGNTYNDVPVNLGLQFQASQDGLLDSVRFYKASNDTATSHTVSLWDSGGNLLAQAVSGNETASGWQQVDFANPVAVTAGQTYTASYLTANGHYEATPQGLASAVTSGPLTALANGGVYTQGTSSAFPVNTYNSSNYWVDVVFTPAAPLAGVNTVGASVCSLPAGEAEAYSYTASASGTSKTISLYVDSGNTAGGGVLGIYANTQYDDPGTLLGQVAFTPQPGWNTITLSGVNIASGQTYWLAALGTGGGTLKFRYGSSSAPYSETEGTSWSSLPSDWGGGYRWSGTGSASEYVSG